MTDYYNRDTPLDPENESHSWKSLLEELEEEKAGKQGRIQDQIEEVKQEMERRQNIHTENERDLHDQIEYQKELIEKTSASIEDDEVMRDRIHSLQEDLRTERRSAFKDLKELKKELRGLRKRCDKLDTDLGSNPEDD